MRWMWIDRFEEFESGVKAVAVKNVSLSEEHIHDHWPAYPVMPQSLMVEGMAQTAGILVGEIDNFEHDVVLAKISNVEFTDIALPGDQVRYEATVEHTSDEASSVSGIISINGKRIGAIRLMLSNSNNAIQKLDLPEKFVFTDSFTRLIEPFLEQDNG